MKTNNTKIICYSEKNAPQTHTSKWTVSLFFHSSWIVDEVCSNIWAAGSLSLKLNVVMKETKWFTHDGTLCWFRFNKKSSAKIVFRLFTIHFIVHNWYVCIPLLFVVVVVFAFDVMHFLCSSMHTFTLSVLEK